MFNVLPIKKILKFVLKKCGFKKRTRIPKTLTENNKDVQEIRSHTGIICFLVVLLVVILIRYRHIYDTNTEKYDNMKFLSSEEANTTLYELYIKGCDTISGAYNMGKLKFLKTLEKHLELASGTALFLNKRVDLALLTIIANYVTSQDTSLPICNFNTTGLGEITVNKTITSYIPQVVYPSVRAGGYYRPEGCRSRHKIAILIPYRNREKNLMVFLYNIHAFLIKQKLEYMIFVIEQKGTDNFNRGKLFNAGFLEMKKFGEWRCVIFHDVDLLPLDDRILYSCPIWPQHMCATVVEVTNPKIRSLFGGVAAMDVKYFEMVDGYSNLYWGWGGEDNELFWRIRASGLPVVRNSKTIGRYTSLEHSAQSPNPLRFSLLATKTERFKKEGLSSLKYKVGSVTLHHLYTHITVDINPDKENTTEIISKWIT